MRATELGGCPGQPPAVANADVLLEAGFRMFPLTTCDQCRLAGWVDGLRTLQGPPFLQVRLGIGGPTLRHELAHQGGGLFEAACMALLLKLENVSNHLQRSRCRALRGNEAGHPLPAVGGLPSPKCSTGNRLQGRRGGLLH